MQGVWSVLFLSLCSWIINTLFLFKIIVVQFTLSCVKKFHQYQSINLLNLPGWSDAATKCKVLSWFLQNSITSLYRSLLFICHSIACKVIRFSFDINVSCSRCLNKSKPSFICSRTFLFNQFWSKWMENLNFMTVRQFCNKKTGLSFAHVHGLLFALLFNKKFHFYRKAAGHQFCVVRRYHNGCNGVLLLDYWQRVFN